MATSNQAIARHLAVGLFYALNQLSTILEHEDIHQSWAELTDLGVRGNFCKDDLLTHQQADKIYE